MTATGCPDPRHLGPGPIRRHDHWSTPIDTPTTSESAAETPEEVAARIAGGKTAAALDEFSEKLAAFNALRRSDEAAADAVLSQLGSHGPVEQDIVRALSLPKPIFNPDRFEEAHELVMKSLDVLRIIGVGSVTLREGRGPLRKLGALVVQLFVRLMLTNYITRAIKQLDFLYARRTSWTPKGTREAAMLQRARMTTGMVLPHYTGLKGGGLPKFLVGGALVSSALGSLRSAAGTVQENPILVTVTTVLLLGGLLGIAWCILRAAAVARRRIRLTSDRPFEALYEVLGITPHVPKDHCMRVALVSLLLMAIAWVVIPAGIFFAVS